MSKFKIGDIVECSGALGGIPEDWRGKVWTVASEPWQCCGVDVVKLVGERGCRRVDCLQLKKCCANCRWWAEVAEVCCNGDSEHRADFTLALDGCDEWETKDKSDNV